MPRAPKDPFKSDKLIMVGLPPQNWLMLLMGSMAFYVGAAQSGMEMERSLILTWTAMLYAAEQGPAGWDQEVAEARDYLAVLMDKHDQPPITEAEMAVIRESVRRYVR